MAGRVDGLVREVDRLVSGSSWVGPDASRFKGQVWPERKARLLGVARDLHGLGQSALNNAAEQEDASQAGASGEASIGTSFGRVSGERPEWFLDPRIPDALDHSQAGGREVARLWRR